MQVKPGVSRTYLPGAPMTLFTALALFVALSPADSAQSSSIRRADFRNGTYLTYGQQITLRDGKAVVPDQRDPVMIRTVKLIDVAFGDLDGDSQEEAAVVIGESTGGTGYYTSGYVYGLKEGRLVLLTTFEGGDRAMGGIDQVRIAGQRLQVVRNHGEVMCCPDYRIATWYRWGRKQLIVARTARLEVRR